MLSHYIDEADTYVVRTLLRSLALLPTHNTETLEITQYHNNTGMTGRRQRPIG